MIIYYVYDDNMEFQYPSTEQVPNSTTVAVPDGLFEPIKWNGTSWVGTPKEVWLQNQTKPTPTKPTAEQTAQAMILKKIVGLETEVRKQQMINANLAKQIVAMKGAK